MRWTRKQRWQASWITTSAYFSHALLAVASLVNCRDNMFDASGMGDKHTG